MVGAEEAEDGGANLRCGAPAEQRLELCRGRGGRAGRERRCGRGARQLFCREEVVALPLVLTLAVAVAVASAVAVVVASSAAASAVARGVRRDERREPTRRAATAGRSFGAIREAERGRDGERSSPSFVSPSADDAADA